MADSPLTIYLSLTSSPSTPRSTLTIPSPTSTYTAAQLRQEAAKITTVPLDKLKLIFRGRVISNKDVGNVVEEYKLENECVVHVMGKPAAGSVSGSGATSAAATSTASAATSATAAGARVTLPSSTTANAAATASSSGSGGSATTPIAAALDKLRSSNDGPTYRLALTTADKLLGNVVAHPMEEKYRTIKKSNPAFTKRLGGLPGGNDLMLASGFTIETREDDSIEYYVLTPSANAWPTLVASREEIGRVLNESNRSTASAVPGAGMPGAHSMPGIGGMPNFMPPGANNAASGGFGGSGGGGMPDMAAVQNMLSDPTMMQNVMGMMNNPMVQNMMRNDPRFANNPMLQQSLQALQSNPEMMNQMASMMSDPAARERMASMMGGMGGNSGTAGGAGAADAFAGGPDAMRRQMEQFQQMSQQFGGSSGGFNTGGAGGGGSGTAAPAGSGTNNDASSNSNITGGNDSDMTEEEMIAEAIRRSMEES